MAITVIVAGQKTQKIINTVISPSQGDFCQTFGFHVIIKPLKML